MRKTNIIFLIFLGFSLLTIGLTSPFAEEIPPGERPKLIIGDDVHYPPYSFLDSSGQPSGFNVELARAVGEAMGYEVEIRLDEWSKIRQALEQEEIDAVAGMFYSAERGELYSFTSNHSRSTGDIFTRNNLRLQGVEDLRGKTVVVQKGDIVAEYLSQLELDINLVQVATVKDALALIENGNYHYAALLKLPGLFTINEHGMDSLQAQGLGLITSDYSMAVKKGKEELILTLNGGLQLIKATGQYQEIYDKWLGIYDEKGIIDVLKAYSWVFLLILIIVINLTLISITLRLMVHSKTKELQETNSILQQSKDELATLNTKLATKVEEIIAIKEKLEKQFHLLLVSERNLKASQERNKAILNALPDIVFTFDKEGRFLDCQASNIEDLLTPKEIFLGKKIEHLLPHHIAKTSVEKIQKAIETEILQTFEYELVLNGERAVFEMRVVKLNDDEALGITRNISSQRFYQERIEYLSYRDQLTNLYNRHYFEDMLHILDIKENLPLAIVMVDVNGLKLVNDSFGHKMGDQLLIKVAETLRKACPEEEVICRIGGDEFVILIPKAKTGRVEKLTRDIKHYCRDEKIGSIELSISFGWEHKVHETEDIQQIFNKAEDFMYKKKLFESPSMRSKTIRAIISTLYEKNRREEEHSQRVSNLCKRLAQVLMFSEREIEEIKTVGLLHDIGKIAINEEILNKPGQLTKEEMEEIKRHPESGYRILSSVNDMAEIAEYVLYHHERWDGQGYPRGLKGEEIPIQARMIAIADAYDAITSNRSYRPARSEEEGIRELLRNSGTQFDPNLVEPFIREVLGYQNMSISPNKAKGEAYG